MDYIVKEYVPSSKIFNGTKKVFIASITSPEIILCKNNNALISSLIDAGLGNAIGLYFYRFKFIDNYNSFSKIGEVTSMNGISNRLKRGWHGTVAYSDTYLNRKLHDDVLEITPSNPMFFVFYEFDLFTSFPKIDEIYAFKKHDNHFKCCTRNAERINANYQLGKDLIFHEPAFNEVLTLDI